MNAVVALGGALEARRRDPYDDAVAWLALHRGLGVEVSPPSVDVQLAKRWGVPSEVVPWVRRMGIRWGVSLQRARRPALRAWREHDERQRRALAAVRARWALGDEGGTR